jgi:Type II CAAX prenyl endopeptidase Rce1-like
MPRSGLRLAVPKLVTEYWQASRSPRYTVLFALPLLILYEALATFLSHGPGPELRNGADVLVQDLFLTVAGRYAPVAFGVTVLVLSVWYIVRNLHTARAPLHPSFFATMLVESGLLALCFMFAVGTLTARLIGVVGRVHIANAHLSSWHVPSWLIAPGSAVARPLLLHFGPATAGGLGGALANTSTATKVMLSLGAGLYEELVFRVVLVSVIAFVTTKVFGWRPSIGTLTAVVVSALIFSAFHYVGPYGDVLRLDSFVFRFIGGLAFSIVYVMRGFGITAWTHTLYDLLVLAG